MIRDSNLIKVDHTVYCAFKRSECSQETVSFGGFTYGNSHL